MQKDRIQHQDKSTAKGLAGNEFSGIPRSSQVKHSHLVPVVDQGRHHSQQITYGSNNNQQKPAASAMLQAPPPGLPSHAQAPGLHPNQVRPQGPRQTLVPPENFAPPFGGGPSSYGPQGPYNEAPVSGAPRLPRQGEHLNPFPLDHSQQFGDRGKFDDDLKQFSRPSHLDSGPVPKYGSYFSSSRSLDRGPHGFAKDMGPWAHEKDPRGLNFDPMIDSGPSRFLPPYHLDDAGEPVGLPEDTLGRPGFLGTVPGYGRHLMDGFVSRSPGRDYSGISSHRFGGRPSDEIDRRRGFDDRFSGFPIHRGGFESSDHMAEHFGPDTRPPHFIRVKILVVITCLVRCGWKDLLALVSF
ncbi:uncharacterized protein LOC120124551 [Hibiscus syriacus]|uniref:uncharacterized protein LOC120124551 n=1 Tax=Hibiscus syriacus TaxID=106335 RepID=UPI0019207280|nr:uncharacterized protein LOC120124551 [Hibiscus syriacus]